MFETRHDSNVSKNLCFARWFYLIFIRISIFKRRDPARKYRNPKLQRAPKSGNTCASIFFLWVESQITNLISAVQIKRLPPNNTQVKEDACAPNICWGRAKCENHQLYFLGVQNTKNTRALQIFFRGGTKCENCKRSFGGPNQGPPQTNTKVKETHFRIFTHKKKCRKR